MMTKFSSWMTGGAAFLAASAALADTAPYFQPLTESAPVTMPNSPEELTAPWVVPAGVSQKNLTSMREIESDSKQSVLRAPDVKDPATGEILSAGTSQSMWDMAAYDATGRFVFVPHETPWSAGLSRYDSWKDETQLLWSGNGQGALENWSNDFAAFDPATFTPNCSVFVAEEWAGEGRLMETLNPFAPVEKIQVRELHSIANVAHEGLRFSHDERTLYFVDEWNSGAIYKFVMTRKGDYTKGQTFVLVVDAFNGNPADNWNEQPEGTPRTGMATWVPLTDKHNRPLTKADPFRNGPTNDPRTESNTRGGRPAADEVNATPYGRPEDMEIGRLANGNEVMYFAATSENSVYTVEMLANDKAMVRAMVTPNTPKNVGFAPTTGVLNSPDNLAQDALGNIFIIEDAPNSSRTGGDIWFARDTNDDGVAESLDHFMSVRADGSEATGMIFHPHDPTKFIVTVMHPTSTDLEATPNGFGDALWEFDVKHAKAPACTTSACPNKLVQKLRWAGAFDSIKNGDFTRSCARAMIKQQLQR
ncbi:MAG TPA: alkaline phosphatase PhoX [Polyangiaceae bacterium]